MITGYKDDIYLPKLPKKKQKMFIAICVLTYFLLAI